MTKTELQVFILAGGSGKRLWPLSTEERPKQFIKFDFLDGQSLIQKTFLRAKRIAAMEDIFFICNSKIKPLIIKQIWELEPKFPPDNIIVEPEARNTLPAISLGMLKAEDFALILPSDHIINKESEFISSIGKAKELAKHSLVTFGIKPDAPKTGYGYIKANNNKVEEFKEKPDEETARRYLKQGYLWNSGMFLFHKHIFEKELKEALPELYSLYEKDLLSAYDKTPKTSIDKGLLEKSSNISVIPLDIEWSDLGSFDSLIPFLSKKENNIIFSDKEVRIIGLSDIILVEGKDGILVCKRGRSEEVKDFD
jgi:mannose-1-phosphate guanylyltransferase/mannose-6-phosphate isomerase